MKRKKQGHSEKAEIHGKFIVECFDKNGKLKWRNEIPNLVTTQGKNFLLDNGLAGVAYTATFYIGLISSVSYTAVAAGDTALQINGSNGWKEAGVSNAPTYTGNRKTAVWSAAGSGTKNLSAALSFLMSGSGTLKGCFLVTTNTVDGTSGSLYSAGLFANGDRSGIQSNDTVNVSYQAILT